MKKRNRTPQQYSTILRSLLLLVYIMTMSGLTAFRERPMDPIPSNQSLTSGNGSYPGPGTINDEPKSSTPSRLLVPNAQNFSQVSQALTTAVDMVNISREDPEQIDPTDLDEDYDNFNHEKYEAVLRGERHYKYLRFEEYWYHEERRVRAIVSVPSSEDGSTRMEYVTHILNILNQDFGIDTSKVSEEEIQQITRDVNELGRFTCIKFLRLVWALFKDGATDERGIFPQVYQMKVVDAGDLANQVEGGFDIFDPNHQNVVKASYVKYANVSNSDPQDRTDLFENKVVVFFRPTDKRIFSGDNGHVGVGHLQAQRDDAGNITGFNISFVEMIGTTGQASYFNQMSFSDFRTHLYFNTPAQDPDSHQIVGWFINRE